MIISVFQILHGHWLLWTCIFVLKMKQPPTLEVGPLPRGEAGALAKRLVQHDRAGSKDMDAARNQLFSAVETHGSEVASPS